MPKLLLWFLLLAFSQVIASHLLPTVVASSAHVSRILLSPSPAPSSSSLPGCPSMCGDVEIPYPFGIGAKCAWPGFEFTIDCNHTSNNHSPIPYTGNIQIKNISVDTGEMRVFTPVAYRCFNSSTTIESRASVSWDLVEPLVISAKKNVFTAIGCSTLAFLEGGRDSYWNYFTGCISSCVSLNASANDGDNCTGLGCCQSSIAAQLSSIVVDWASDNGSTNPSWDYSPCSYGFVAEMGSYNFSRLDLSGTGNESFISRVGETTIPLVLDWAITKNGSCYRGPSGQMTAPACVNEHSECITSAQGDGYLCKCSKGYQGNPYLHDGCQDTDECDLPNQYPCGSGSRCENTRGTYKCKCKLFHIADGRNGCQNILRPVAIPAIFVVVVLACLVIITLLQSRNRKKLFNKNGGKILEAHGMTIYTQRQLKKITKSYSKSLGKGQFGIVYEGIIDGATANVSPLNALS